jgi:predicted amidohydrolase YtcJ
MTTKDTAATLYRNGQVHAIDGTAPPGDALLVRDGRVAALGRESDVRAAAGARFETVDLRGATLMPGFVDTHPHLLHFGALSYPLVDLSDARDHDDIVARIRRKAADTPKGKWVMTTPVGEPHYFIRRSWHNLAERALPDRHVLDRATTDHPVYLQAWGPRTPNDCVFNSAGLAAIGITPSTPIAKAMCGWRRTRTESPPGACTARSTRTTPASRTWTRCCATCRCSHPRPRSPARARRWASTTAWA